MKPAPPFAHQFDGRTAMGTWTQVADADLIDMLGRAGFDFTILDCEHGALDVAALPSLVRACEAAGMVPWARAPKADAAWVGRVLDSGVRGIVVPAAESAGALAEMVEGARYAPLGSRGACPIVRAGGHLIEDWASHARREDAAVGVVALVETPAGVAAANELCSVPRLGAVMLGPFDLSVAMGVPGQLAAPEITTALDQVIAAAHRHHLPVLMPVFSSNADELGRQARYWLGRGVTALTVGADKLFFMTAAEAALRAASAALATGAQLRA